MSEQSVETQVIANLVITNADGHVLFVRYDPENEKWWLPGRDVEPYTHPDDRAIQVLTEMEGLEAGEPVFDHVESFRGRRGWHLAFHYKVEASGTPTGDTPAQWFPTDSLPETVHGGWEKQIVAKLTGN